MRAPFRGIQRSRHPRCHCFACPWNCSCAGATRRPPQQSGPSQGGKALTVESISSQQSLSGRLTRGIAWTNDGEPAQYFETKMGKEAKTGILGARDARPGNDGPICCLLTKLEISAAETSRPHASTGLGTALRVRTIKGNRMARNLGSSQRPLVAGWMRSAKRDASGSGKAGTSRSNGFPDCRYEVSCAIPPCLGR